MSDIAFKYDAEKNPEGVWLDGVPLRDLTADEVKAMKPHYRAAVKASPFYIEVKAKKAAEKDGKK
jgi:hypothetical protein